MENYSIYLSTETEKYNIINLSRAAGAVLVDVSGCGTGYMVTIQATPEQAARINEQLGANA